MVKILLVEDDKSFGYVLTEYMKLKGYSVFWKESISKLMESIANENYDLAILDINLKDGSGYDVANILRKERPEMPFIFLTARDLKIDQLKGYQLGAEEYITKPIDEEILLAKISVILSRKKGKTPIGERLQWNSISLDSVKRELQVGEQQYHLTEKENLLMSAFLITPNKLVLRKDILQEIWENQDEFSRNSMDVYISRLRKYLSQGCESTIRNVHGKGFVLE